MPRSHELEWCKRFWEGHVPLQDDARPGQSHGAITPEFITLVDECSREIQRVTVEDILLLMKKSRGCHDSVNTIMRNHMHYQNVCVQWVPHHLTEEQNTHKMAMSLGHM
ncbi:hypothetical protein PR048_021111 [Dryococelus australis]|uniref:Uncharacterized protein n=1 Tax=Dryococelus australis TaxID=614101 RepID=A0ABQ9GXA8_9NEOP|nr:hypothetical protein PR048_021111 [Dryococelus australis]